MSKTRDYRISYIMYFKKWILSYTVSDYGVPGQKSIFWIFSVKKAY